MFADLYHRRWGIETDYRRLKQTLCLDNFSGRSVTAVKQDFHAGQLLKNLALLMQHLLQPVIEQRHKDRKPRWKVNFTQGVRASRTPWSTCWYAPVAETDQRADVDDQQPQRRASGTLL